MKGREKEGEGEGGGEGDELKRKHAQLDRWSVPEMHWVSGKGTYRGSVLQICKSVGYHIRKGL